MFPFLLAEVGNEHMTVQTLSQQCKGSTMQSVNEDFYSGYVSIYILNPKGRRQSSVLSKILLIGT